MILRSIWRWMILDIKRKKKEKRIQLFGALIGICVAVEEHDRAVGLLQLPDLFHRFQLVLG